MAWRSLPRVARSQGEILGYTNLKNVTEFFPDFFREYTHDKLKRKIKTRYLSPTTVDSGESPAAVSSESYDDNLVEILLVNKDQFLFENEVLIFNNSVGIVSLNKDELLRINRRKPYICPDNEGVFDLAWLRATAFVAK